MGAYLCLQAEERRLVYLYTHRQYRVKTTEPAFRSHLLHLAMGPGQVTYTKADENGI